MAYRILLAPDKFKGSLTSFEVCNALEKGLRMARPDIEVIHLPMADGGEGWLELIAHYTQGKEIPLEVSNPLFQSVKASWLLSPDGNNAFVEMAKASGLQLLTPSTYDPVHASTFGTGQLIKAAVKSGAKNIYIGVGGSATNDGGIGMAAALGYKFLDASGKELLPIGGNLIHINTIDSRGKFDFNNAKFVVATDVKNPLFGEDGATRTYGPQKGADADMVEELENGICNYSEVLKRELGIDLSNVEGAGAAGGLGAGCIAFLNASIQPGFELLWDFAKGEQQIKDCNLIITGEGKVDIQTLSGKVVAGIASKSKQFQKKLILICGSLELSPEELKSLDISTTHSLMDKSMSLEEAIKKAPMLVEKIGYEIGSSVD
jgi:glycerate 2-kinase